GFVLRISFEVNLESFLARLEPLHNVGIIFEQRRKAAFGVGLEPLCWVQALLKTAKEHTPDQQFFFDWNSKVPWFLTNGNRIAVGPQSREALGDMRFVLARPFLIVILHLR